MKILVDFVHGASSLLLVLVLLNPIGLILRVKSVPQFSSHTTVEEDNWRRDYRALTTEIIFSLQQYSLSSNILTADVDIHDDLGHLDGERIHQKLIPAIVFGKKKKLSTFPTFFNSLNGTANPSASRFTSSNFLHVNVQLTPTTPWRWKWSRGTQFDPHWKKLYSLTLGQSSEFTQLPDRALLYDYFLNFQDSIHSLSTLETNDHPQTGDNLQFHHHSRNIRSFHGRGGGKGSKSQRTGIPENIIWIQMQVIIFNTIPHYEAEEGGKINARAQSEKCDGYDHSTSLGRGGGGGRAEDVEDFLTSSNSSSQKKVPDPEFKGEFDAQSSPGSEDEKKLKNLQDNDLDCHEEEVEDRNSNNSNLNSKENVNNPRPPQVKFFLSCDESCIIEGSNFGYTNQSLTVDSNLELLCPEGDDEDTSINSRSSSRVFLISKKRSTACLLRRVASKMKFPISLTPPIFDSDGGLIPHMPGIEESAEIFKRNVDSKFLENYGKGTILYNSLVFIAKKQFNNVDSNMRPFSWAGWLAIVLACGATAINFRKILTITNSDQLSWYDFIVQQILELMHEDRSSRKKFFGTSTTSSNNGENGNQTNEDTTTGDDNEEEDTMLEERGKASRALLHGTIRIFSFLLLALYEGKLYNTITFPKNRFVSTFDELLTNDKYALKISREATNVDFLMATKNHSLLNRFSESFNIEDCINWVEHSVSHGCVAYDFEFRNLPKAHKARVLNEVNIFAKSKTSILNLSTFRHYRPSYAAAAQISRWILEAGIFQFWMVAENFFTENLITSRVTKRKFFSIKDYLGFSVIYVAILILALMIFASEIIVNWFKKKFGDRTLIDFVILYWNSVKRLARSLWRLCVQVKSFCVTRQKCCMKIKRIVNNIV